MTRHVGSPGSRNPGTASSLDSLVSGIAACRVCRDAPAGPPLPHEPRPVVRVSRTATILLAGQAPGTRVHASGLPYDDRSGDRLREWLGVDAATFYDVRRIAIVPMGFCFPGHDAHGGDLPPRRECARTWHDRLFDELPALRLIVAIGRPAQVYHLDRLGRGFLLAPTLTETVRRWRAIHEAGSPRVIVLPHPSWRNTGWLKRHPWFEADVLPVLRAEVARELGR